MMNTNIVKLLTLVSLFVVVAVKKAEACVIPTGLEKLDTNSLTIPADGGWLQLTGATITDLTKYETPIQTEIAQVGGIGLYNTVASYHAVSLDLFGRPIPDRFCQNQPSQDYFDLHRRLAMIYLIYFNSLPESIPTANGIMQSYNLSINVCDLFGCNDSSTPWGLAKKYSDQGYDWQKRDGWNSDGSLTQKYFRFPYQDWTNPPYQPNLEDVNSWKPIVEQNKRGFVSEAHHITPHIGQRAKSIFFSDAFICSKQSPEPPPVKFSWLYLTANRTANLNDLTKLDAELFDSKFTSFLPLLVQYFLRKGGTLDSFDYIQADLVVISILYEATMIVWKEKIRYSAVRPATAMQTLFRNKNIFSYAGPGIGPKWMLGKDWQSYLRTMPHAEYPSGSSCVCEAFATGMKELEGTDDIVSKIGGPLVMTSLKGSSKYEPGITPPNDMTLTFFKWSEIADRCAQSRLNSGVHFDRSIIAGKELCKNIGPKIVRAYRKLANGIPLSQGTPQFDAPLKTQDRC